MNYFVYIKDILAIKTNSKNFSWVYGRVAPKASEDEYSKCKIKINLEVRKTDDVFDKSFIKKDYNKYNYFYAKENGKKIYYERSFIFNSKLRYVIEIIDNTTINVVVNKNYFKYIKYRFMNLYSIDYILTDIVSGILLINGYATLHCSSVEIGDRTMIIFGPPGIGKTFTAINLCNNKNAKFISEDISITDGINIYSVPWTSSFRFYKQDKETLGNSIVNLLEKIIPFFELISIGNKESIDSYLDSGAYISLAKITDILLLARGEKSIIKSNEGMLESIINLNKYEFNYHKSPVMLVFNYFNKSISLDGMYKIEYELINQIVKNANSYKIFANNALDYSEIIINDII